MLFPCLDGQDVARPALTIDGGTADTSGHLAHQALCDGHIAGARAAEGQGKSQGLCFTDRDVDARVAGTLQNRKTHRIL